MQSLSLICLLPLVAGIPFSHYNNYNNFRVSRFIQAPVQKAAYAGYGYGYASPSKYYGYSGYRYSSPSYYGSYSRIAPRVNLRTGDIIAETRALSNSVQATLRQLAADPASAVIVNRIINDNDNICVSSLEDGLAGIETATRLVERAGNDIKALIAKVESFGSVTAPAAVVREVAAILRILQPLVKNIAPDQPVICAASPDQAFGSLRSLAVLVDELSYTNQLALSPAGRAQLKESANTISAVTTFLTKLRANFARFEQICTADRQYNTDAIRAIGDLMVDLADMFGSLGGVKSGEGIRKGQTFVNNVVVSFKFFLKSILFFISVDNKLFYFSHN